MRMRLRLNDERGFTLTEVLISTVVLSLFLIGMYGMYRYARDSYNTGDYMFDLQRESHAVLYDMTRELKLAQIVTLTDYDGIYSVYHGVDAILKTDPLDAVNEIYRVSYWPDEDGNLYRQAEMEDGWVTTDEKLVDSSDDYTYLDNLEFEYDGISTAPGHNWRLLGIRLKMKLGQLPPGATTLIRDDTGCEEDCVELFYNVNLRNWVYQPPPPPPP